MPTCDELIAAVQAFEKTFTGHNTVTAMHEALKEAERTRAPTAQPDFQISKDKFLTMETVQHG